MQVFFGVGLRYRDLEIHPTGLRIPEITDRPEPR